MAQPIIITPQLPQELASIVEKAQTSWLSNDEVLRLLDDFSSLGITYNTDLPNRPPGGTLFFFSRQACRNFRKDGHNWRLKNDGRSIRETHEKLKVGNTEALNCYYAHADQDDNLQRRSYWRLREDLKDLILVHYLCTAVTRVNGGRGVRASSNTMETIAATRPRRASRASTRRRSDYSSEEEENDDDYEFEDDEEEYEEEKIYRGGVISLGESSDFGNLTNSITMDALDYVGGSSAELQLLHNDNNKKKLPSRQARDAARTQFANILDSSSSGLSSGQLVSSQSDELVYKNRQRMQRQAANAHTAQQPQHIFSGRPLAVNGVSFQPDLPTQTIFLAQQHQAEEGHAPHVNVTNNNNNNNVPLSHRISDPTILRQMSLGIRTISNNMQVSLGPFHEESQELPPIAPLCNTDLMNQQQQPGGSTSADGTTTIDRLTSSDRINLSQALSSGTLSGLFSQQQITNNNNNVTHQQQQQQQHLAGGGGSLTLGLLQRQFSRQSSGGIPRLMSDFRHDSLPMPDSLLLPAIGGSFNFDADGDLPLGAILNHNTQQLLDPAGVHHHPKAGTTFIDKRLSAERGDLAAAAAAVAVADNKLDPSPITHTLLGVGDKGSRESDMTAVFGSEADDPPNNNKNTSSPSHLVSQISDLGPLLTELDQSSGGNYTTPSIKGELAMRPSRSVSRSGSQGNLTTLSRRSTGSGAMPVNNITTTTSGTMMEESAAEAVLRREKRQAAAASLAATAASSDRDARLTRARVGRQQLFVAAPTTTTSSEEEYIAAIGGQNTATVTNDEDDEMMIQGPNNLWRLQSFLFQKGKSGNRDGDAAAVAATNGLFKHMSIDEAAIVGAAATATAAAAAATAAAAAAASDGMESSGGGFGSLMMAGENTTRDLHSSPGGRGGQGMEDDDLVVTGRGGSVTSKQPAALGVSAGNR